MKAHNTININTLQLVTIYISSLQLVQALSSGYFLYKTKEIYLLKIYEILSFLLKKTKVFQISEEKTFVIFHHS